MNYSPLKKGGHKMPTQAQTIANRSNAQKSTGPRTQEGKAAASQNSIKHGLLANQNVISSESQDEFDLYRDQLLEELNPATPLESMLAERIVSLSWRLKRTETIQNQAIDALNERTKNNPLAQLANSFLPKHLQPPKKDPTVPELDLTLGRLVIKDFSNERVLDRLLMYERRIENSLHKTMLELQRLKLINNINTENESPTDNSTNEPDNHPTNQPVNLQSKNMQNEPNLKNPQINVTSAKTKNYENNRLYEHRKNEPNTNPFLPSSLSNEALAKLKVFAKAEKKTQFMKKQTQTVVA
jgi:hypothetical protein